MTIQPDLKFSYEVFNFWRIHKNETDVVLRLSVLTHRSYKETQRLINFFKAEMTHRAAWREYKEECAKLEKDERLRTMEEVFRRNRPIKTSYWRKRDNLDTAKVWY